MDVSDDLDEVRARLVVARMLAEHTTDGPTGRKARAWIERMEYQVERIEQLMIRRAQGASPPVLAGH